MAKTTNRKKKRALQRSRRREEAWYREWCRNNRLFAYAEKHAVVYGTVRGRDDIEINNVMHGQTGHEPRQCITRNIMCNWPSPTELTPSQARDLGKILLAAARRKGCRS